MGRRLHEATITTRNARAALPIRLHWRAIDPDVHLGYRKGKSGGGWIVRWRSGPGYRQAPLGTADDVLDADGANTFSYAQAASACRSHVTKTRYDDRAAAEAKAQRKNGLRGLLSFHRIPGRRATWTGLQALPIAAPDPRACESENRRQGTARDEVAGLRGLEGPASRQTPRRNYSAANFE